MRRPGFLQGVAVAAALSVAGAAFVAVFLPFLGIATLARLAVSGLTFAYVLYLLGRSGEKRGRISVLLLIAAVAFASWFSVDSFAVYVLVHAAAIWLVRALYFYSSALAALADLGLSGLSAVVALGTLMRTGSAFLAIWAFFLTQALFVVIPATLRRRAKQSAAQTDGFERSRRQAEAALQQLITD